jgi:ubiquitin-like protein Pup
MSVLLGNVVLNPGRGRLPAQLAWEVEMAQEQVQRQGGGDGDEGDDAAAAAGQERREKLGEDVDAILDEIDDVLEENAEDFVRAYVQKGGQ